MFHDIIVIGGGASGIMASLVAKDMGSDVAIIEHKDRVAKKILVTGNGRCNISNNSIDINNYHTSSSKELIKNILSNFSLNDTKDFFKSIGLNLTLLENDKLYPLSLQASSVVDLLLFSLNDKSIPLYLNTQVFDISKKDNKFLIVTNNEEYSCNKLIIATGGKSYPKTGSDGSGYKYAKIFKHNIVKLMPAIVQVTLNYPKLKALSGVKFNGNATVFVNKKMIRSEYGEILFTDYGISGPPILQLSGIISRNSNCTIDLDLFPEMSIDNLSDFLESHWGIVGYRSIHDSFIGLLNKKLIPIFLKDCGIHNIHKPCWEITSDEHNVIINTLKSWKFIATGTKSFDSAQVTSGGVSLDEINPVTLESTKEKNLFFCGEILDVDGDCGGYNLQWAWSSGAVAGKNASK
ncbi:NAD(P)/FAD-dependent oxidoreductase [Oceanirhabdus sp. W0125-5]|uniref:NAD(P)/FAD-dependent oxidoreductase n=1 Tax=Oceanirhabdus sp. W0125-5 TaxID=2999116 RepID=UPI0022F2BAC4|nr:NAD(P)/FAD-dependent oxidoreductase [Oceanirhabdus sp. W0125-5]WBW97637.1 NAD(P)/FAD-dependent oxidoreductase [Oceanirhabdus sp. W0125-5]